MLEMFKIIPTEYVSEDTIILISPLTYEETTKCKTIEEVFKLLFKKKKIAVIQNLNGVKNE